MCFLFPFLFQFFGCRSSRDSDVNNTIIYFLKTRVENGDNILIFDTGYRSEEKNHETQSMGYNSERWAVRKKPTTLNNKDEVITTANPQAGQFPKN